MGWLLPLLALVSIAPRHDGSATPVAFFVQGMSCEDCVKEVRTTLVKVPTITGLDLKLKPPIARFRIAAEKVSLQEIVLAIRGGAKRFDGKLLVEEDPGLTQKALDDLDKAISAVPGVKNSGAPDEHGRRLITLDLTKKTRLADVIGAARSAGVELRTPPADSH